MSFRDELNKATGGRGDQIIASTLSGGATALPDILTNGKATDSILTVGKVASGEAAAEEARDQQERLKQAMLDAKKLETTANTDSTSTNTSQTTFKPRSWQENILLNASADSFKRGQDLAGEFENSILARQGVQNQAQGALGGILSGDAFGLTADENARIQALTGAQLEQGSSRINDFLNERLGQLNASAAQRGLRGQAFSQLQTGAVSEAADQLTQQQLAANQTGAQLALQLPGQRVSQQASTAGGLAAFADDARNQAIQNRNVLQNPAALQMLRDERLAGGKTTTSNTSSSKQVGTGAGVVDLLKAQATATSPNAARIGGASGTVNQVLNVGASVLGAKG